MTEPDPDIAARRALAQHRAFATGLLVAMAALAIYATSLPDGVVADFLRASSKAGLVGGLADWFAITALFRHPLGLPIPHTAILPNQKARLGRALGRFMANHVFTREDVAKNIARLDVPKILQRFLSDPTAMRPAAQEMAKLMPRALTAVEDGRARRALGRIVPRILGGAGTGRVVGRAMRGLVEGGRHQEVFGFILTQVRTALAASETRLRAVIEERVREQGGRLVGWALGATVATRVLATLNSEMDKIGPDGSDLRAAFDEWVRREITRIEEDPQRAAEIGRAVRNVVGHETVQAWMWDVWARIRLALEADATRPSGHTVAFFEGAFANLGSLLANDDAARARLERGIEGVVNSLLPIAQVQLADFIADVVTGWDDRTITDRLELRVGKDLQFVRINGTLVGFLAGGLVELVLRAIFGRPMF